jgi:hypothetical protein
MPMSSPHPALAQRSGRGFPEGSGGERVSRHFSEPSPKRGTSGIGRGQGEGRSPGEHFFMITNAQYNQKPRRQGWKIAGWQGITVEAPPDWNLVGFGGESKAGNLRLDSGDAQNGVLGLEVRWSQPKGKFTDAMLTQRLEPFFASIIKTARKQKSLAKTESHITQDDRFPERDAQRGFGWRTDRKGIGRIWHCAECGRMCIAQVVGQPGRDFTATAQDVLASLRCHPAETGWRTWALYDLKTQVPADYALKGSPQLMNVYLQLSFQYGQSLDTITVEQWSMAGTQIKGAYLDEWFREKNKSLEPTLRCESSESESHGHPALELIGHRGGVQYWVGQVPSQLLRLQRPALHFAALLWECPESNTIILVQSLSRRPQVELMREIATRTPCH